MGGWICSNPGLSGLIQIGALLAEYGINALAAYFQNPLFSILAVFLDALISDFAKDGAYAGVQSIATQDPLTAYIGANMVNWAQAGAANGGDTPAEYGPPATMSALINAGIMLSNRNPSGPYWTLWSSHDAGGTLGVFNSWRMSGFIPIPKSTNPTAIQFFTPGTPAPLDPAAYAAKYGFPPPTADQLAAFFLNPDVPTFNDYGPTQWTDPNLPTLVANALFNAFGQWFGVCGGASQPGAGPGSGGGTGSGGTGPGALPPPPPGPGDELTDCCQNLATALGKLGDTLAKLLQPPPAQPGPTQGPQPSSDCCAQVVEAIGKVAAELATIATAAGTPAPGGTVNIDLAPLVDEVAQLVTAVKANTPPPAPDLTGISDQLKAIADAITKAPAVDVKAIADSFAAADALAPMVKTTGQQLVNDGIIAADVAQGVLSS